MRANDRLVSILALLGGEGPLTLTDIAGRLDLSKATALRFLRSLEGPKWVTRDGDSRYALGPGLVALARRYLSTDSLIVAAAGPMADLRDRLSETVSLSCAVGTARVCVQEFPSPHALRHVHDIGAAAPLHAGASGKLILAYLTEAERAEVLAGPLPRYTRRTLTSPARLERECRTIRKRGWTLSYGEKTGGSVALAVPVRAGVTGPVAALAIFAPEARFAEDRDLSVWTRELMETARRIESTLGQREGAEGVA